INNHQDSFQKLSTLSILENVEINDQVLIHHFPSNITNLTLSNCHEITGYGINAVIKKSSNLTKLNLTNCYQYFSITNDINQLEYTDNITTLNLSGTVINDDS